jgi:REP element-mobilizing transposase RayT
MTPPDDRPHRSSTRLQHYDYSQAGAYFVTICTQDRACLFGAIENGAMVLNEYGCVVRDEWLKTAESRAEIKMGEFVVMPNHFHGIVVIGEATIEAIRERAIHELPLHQGCPVGAIHESPEQSGATPNVGAIHELPLSLRQQRRQMALSKIVGRFKMLTAKRINETRQLPGVSLWQRNYYEHVIRNEDDYRGIAEYIADNPHRWEEDVLHPNAPKM